MKKAKLLQALLCATALAAAQPAFADEFDGSVSVFSAEDLTPAAFLAAASWEKEACLVVAAFKAQALDATTHSTFATLALANPNFDAAEAPIAVAAFDAPVLQAAGYTLTTVTPVTLAHFEDEAAEPVMVAALEARGIDAAQAETPMTVFALYTVSFEDEVETPVIVAALEAQGLDAAQAQAPTTVLALATASFEEEAEAPVMVAALEAQGLDAAQAEAPMTVLALATASFEEEAEAPVMVAALEAEGMGVAPAAAPAMILALANPSLAADEAPTPLAAEEDGTMVLAANELEGLAGGTGVTSAILTEQNLTAINRGNSVTGYNVGSGEINIGSNAFSGFDGVGNFVLNTGHNNNLQSSLNVSIVLGQ